MKDDIKSMIIIMLILATVGLALSIIVIAFSRSELAAQVDELSSKLEDKDDYADNLGMATCLIGGGATKLKAIECRQKTDYFKKMSNEKLEEYVKTVGFGY